MSAAARRIGAVIAAAVAAFGLCVGPALHGEVHARERERALQRLFEVAFDGVCGKEHAEALARALEEALGDGESHHHGGPQRSRSHGEGSLAHLAIATHPAPPVPLLPLPAAMPEQRVALYKPAHVLPRYLVAERSQAPPRSGV